MNGFKKASPSGNHMVDGVGFDFSGGSIPINSKLDIQTQINRKIWLLDNADLTREMRISIKNKIKELEGEINNV